MEYAPPFSSEPRGELGWEDFSPVTIREKISSGDLGTALSMLAIRLSGVRGTKSDAEQMLIEDTPSVASEDWEESIDFFRKEIEELERLENEIKIRLQEEQNKIIQDLSNDVGDQIALLQRLETVNAALRDSNQDD